jgi:hypothetical protein
MRKLTLKQWERDVATLEKLNEHFHIYILMKANFAPFPFERVPIEEIAEHIGRFAIVRREDPNAGK